MPKNVICTALFNLPIAQFAALFSIVTRLISKILLRGSRFLNPTPNKDYKAYRKISKKLNLFNHKAALAITAGVYSEIVQPSKRENCYLDVTCLSYGMFIFPALGA
ncbi:MAG: hypothetical protein V7K32_15685 [Nostoc sp.]|uniref:hypothetical protein n=1 Tax=Nostoc sp. TaxID=1180 RepID=UPI002FF503BA